MPLIITSSFKKCLYDSFNQLSNLIVWLSADDLNSTLNDGDSVSTWTDLSGSGNNATQGTPANQPVLKKNIINGHSVIRFSSLPQYLTISSALLDTAASDGTILIVSNYSSTPNNGVLLSTRDGTSGDTRGWSLRYNASGTSVTYLHTAISAYTKSIVHRVNLIEVRRDGLNIEVGLDGILGPPVVFGGLNSSTGGIGTRIGGHFSSATSQFYGDIAEILIFNTTLNYNLLNNVERCLYYKYFV